MTSKREQILDAIEALVKAALPSAKVKRNAAKAQGLQPGGIVLIRDGEPGEPEVDLSPLMYYYTHRIPLEIAPFPSEDNETALDTMMIEIGNAVQADTTLGGLAMFAEPEAATTADLETTGCAAGLWADAAIVVTYATPNPLN